MHGTHLQTDTLSNWLSVPGNSIEKHYIYSYNQMWFNGLIYRKKGMPIYAIVFYYMYGRTDEKVQEEKNFDVQGWADDDINELFKSPFSPIKF